MAKTLEELFTNEDTPFGLIDQETKHIYHTLINQQDKESRLTKYKENLLKESINLLDSGRSNNNKHQILSSLSFLLDLTLAINKDDQRAFTTKLKDNLFKVLSDSTLIKDVKPMVSDELSKQWSSFIHPSSNTFDKKDDIASLANGVKYQKKHKKFIKSFLLKDWAGELGDVLNIDYNNDLITFKNDSIFDETIKNKLRMDIDKIDIQKVYINLPFSASFYKNELIKKSQSSRVYLLWNDNGYGDWNSSTFTNNKTINNNNNNNNNNKDEVNKVIFTISGFKDDTKSFKNYIINIKNNMTKSFYLDELHRSKYNDSLCWSKLITKEQNVYFDKISSRVIIETLKVEDLIDASKKVQELLKYLEIEKYERFQIEYLQKKGIIDKLKETYPNAFILVDLLKNQIEINSTGKDIIDIKKEISGVLDDIISKDIDLKPNELPLIQFMASKIKSIISNTTKHDEVFLSTTRLSQDPKDERFDLKQVKIYGRKEDLEKLESSLLSFKTSLVCKDYSPPNMIPLIKFLYAKENRSKKEEIERTYNSIIKTEKNSITIYLESEKYFENLQKVLQDLVLKVPIEFKNINVENYLISNELKHFELKAKESGVRYTLSEQSITLSGNPIKVDLLYNEIIQFKSQLEKQFKTEKIFITKATYDLLFEHKKVNDIQKWSKVSVRVSNDSFMKSIDLTTINGDRKRISIKKDDITRIKVDAIVNPANNNLINGSGCARAIEEAAGKEYLNQCINYIKNHSTLPTGTVLLTSSYDLKSCKYIINAVGPDTRDPYQKIAKKDLLTKTIQSCLSSAEQNKLKSIAMPIISSGIFGYDVKEAAKIHISVVIDFLKNKANSLENVYFIDRNKNTIKILEELTEDYDKIETTSFSISMTPKNTIKREKLHYQWSWRENDGTFIPYDEDQCIQIEEKYNSIQNMKQLQGEVEVTGDRGKVQNGYRYTVYFRNINDPNTWYQLNNTLKVTKRLVKRVLLSNPPPISTPTNYYNNLTYNNNNNIEGEKDNENDYKISVYGKEENIKDFQKNLFKLEQDFIKKEIIKDIILSNEVFNELSLKARKIGVKLLKSSNTYELSGLKEKINELKLLILEKKSSKSQYTYPSNWDLTQKTPILLPVSQGSGEWNRIHQEMSKTLSNTFKILKIEIVQNIYAYDNYCHTKEQFKGKLNGDDGECELFHGTRGTDPKEIYESEACFDFRFSNDGL